MEKQYRMVGREEVRLALSPPTRGNLEPYLLYVSKSKVLAGVLRSRRRCWIADTGPYRLCSTMTMQTLLCGAQDQPAAG